MNTNSQKFSVVPFLLITFAWTWLFWFAAIPVREQPLLLVSLVMIGGFGPAVGGLLSLNLQSGFKLDLSTKRMLVFVLASALLFGVMALRYMVGNIPDYDILAADLTLSVPVILAALAASLVGGWVFSSAVSAVPLVRDRMQTIFPWRKFSRWTILALIFFPLLILAAWGLAELLGLGVEYPSLWGESAIRVIPIYALSFVLVALTQGGNEEPGWRGFLQPELQKRFSPLVAALIVSLFWSLWHLPLYLNGFYPGDLVGGMLGGFVYRILLSIFLAWFYNRSGGSVFAMIFLHTCFNLMVNYLPTSDLGLLVLWLVVVLVVVFKDKMYRNPVANSGTARKVTSDEKVFN